MMSKVFFSFVILPCIVFSSCNQHADLEQKKFTAEEIAFESRRANTFFDSTFEASLNRDPERQTTLGIKKNYDEWTDRSDEHAKRENEILKNELERLHKSFDFDKLDDRTRLSYSCFEYSTQEAIDHFRWRFYNYPVNQADGVQSALPAFLIRMHRVDTVTDAQAYIARLKKINIVFDQVIAGLKKRDSMHITPPKFIFPLLMSDCKSIITGEPFDYSGVRSPLYGDFIFKINSLKNADANIKSKLIRDAKDALLQVVKPAYEKLMTYLSEEEKNATPDDGAWKFPDGAKFYAAALKSIATTDVTPDEVFETGQEEVKRIQDEMKIILKQVHWKNDDLHDFFESLRKDKQFYFPNAAAGKKMYTDKATAIMDTMRNKLDQLFNMKPKATELFREKYAGSTFSPGQSIYKIEALAYREEIPGHRFQSAIVQESNDIPEFRKRDSNVAYTDGWAMYAECIPKEVGLYQDPYSDFGRLADEVFHAAMLVVDVGIHQKKWTRKQALDYLIRNTPVPENECRGAVDYCTVNPALATGCKIGMMKILELRGKAQKVLGDKFDLREFHDVILGDGSLPMNLLSDRVRSWMERKKVGN